MNSSVSVIVPTYNGASFIQCAIESIWNQTCFPNEILLVDDCSSDATPELLLDLASRSPVPLRFLRLPRNTGGPPHPLNVAVEQAHGEIILSLDQDDRMVPKRVEMMAACLEANPTIPLAFGLSCDTDFYGMPQSVPNIRAARVYEIPHQTLEDGLLLDPLSTYVKAISEGNFLIGASNIAFRKADWRAVGGFRETEPQVWDYDFLCKMTRRGPIGFVPHVLSYIRRYPTSLSAQLERSVLARLRLTAEHLNRPYWPLTIETRRLTRERMSAEYMGLGYHAVKTGRWLLALQCYRSAFSLSPRSLSPVWSACKLPAHCLHSRLSRLQSNP